MGFLTWKEGTLSQGPKPVFKREKQVFHERRTQALSEGCSWRQPPQVGWVQWEMLGWGVGGATPVWGFCLMGFMGFKKPLNYMQNFLSPLYFSKVGHPEFTSHSRKLCHTPPPNTREWITPTFTIVFHAVVYNAVIENKELDAFSFTFTWKDWTHSLLMTQKHVSEWWRQNGLEAPQEQRWSVLFTAAFQYLETVSSSEKVLHAHFLN